MVIHMMLSHAHVRSRVDLPLHGAFSPVVVVDVQELLIKAPRCRKLCEEWSSVGVVLNVNNRHSSWLAYYPPLCDMGGEGVLPTWHGSGRREEAGSTASSGFHLHLFVYVEALSPQPVRAPLPRNIVVGTARGDSRIWTLRGAQPRGLNSSVANDIRSICKVVVAHWYPHQK